MKNNFAGSSKQLDRTIKLLEYQNMLQYYSSCLKFLQTYFDSPAKLFLDLCLVKFLYSSAKLLFLCKISDAHRNSVLSQDMNSKLLMKISSFLIEKKIFFSSQIFSLHMYIHLQKYSLLR